MPGTKPSYDMEFGASSTIWYGRKSVARRWDSAN
jgi:hypothetical protein